MSDQVLSVADAKRRFSEILDRVSKGETFIVTRHGKPVLKLSRPLPGDNGEPQPLGLLAGLGALSDWPEFEEVMKEVIAARQFASERPPPDFSDKNEY